MPEEIEIRLAESATEPPQVKRDPAASTREELLVGRDEQVEKELAAMPEDVIEEAQAMLGDPKLIDCI
ncbi:MAG: hypothetical protein IID33_12855, partial [Planctomycetes bacterium]|nr:hypothetical protein [Planctomycetota bacterium]